MALPTPGPALFVLAAAPAVGDASELWKFTAFPSVAISTVDRTPRAAKRP